MSDDDEGKGRRPTTADEAKIRAFVRKTPNLSDDKFHDFAERLGVNVHQAEEVVYHMARALHGGEAEKKKGVKFDPKQMAKGRKVEMEHTKDPHVAKEITRDHLAEIPDYYTRLHKMESEAKKTAAFEAGAVAKIAELVGMTYDPNNVNVKAMQARYGAKWKSRLAKERGISESKIRET